MCWVMPPASPATTLALRIWSSSFVLPWSTWPITVITGGRGSCSPRRPRRRRRSKQLLQLDLLLLARVDERISAPTSAANSSIMSSVSDWVAVTISPCCIRKRTTSAAVRFSFGPSSCGASSRARRRPSPSGTGASDGRVGRRARCGCSSSRSATTATPTLARRRVRAADRRGHRDHRRRGRRRDRRRAAPNGTAAGAAQGRPAPPPGRGPPGPPTATGATGRAPPGPPGRVPGPTGDAGRRRDRPAGRRRLGRRGPGGGGIGLPLGDDGPRSRAAAGWAGRSATSGRGPGRRRPRPGAAGPAGARQAARAGGGRRSASAGRGAAVGAGGTGARRWLLITRCSGSSASAGAALAAGAAGSGTGSAPVRGRERRRAAGAGSGAAAAAGADGDDRRLGDDRRHDGDRRRRDDGLDGRHGRWCGLGFGDGCDYLGGDRSRLGVRARLRRRAWRRPSWRPSSVPRAGRRGAGRRARPCGETRSAWASTMLEEWLFTPMPSGSQRSRASLLVSPSSFASSWTRIFPAKGEVVLSLVQLAMVTSRTDARRRESLSRLLGAVEELAANLRQRLGRTSLRSARRSPGAARLGRSTRASRHRARRPGRAVSLDQQRYRHRGHLRPASWPVGRRAATADARATRAAGLLRTRRRPAVDSAGAAGAASVVDGLVRGGLALLDAGSALPLLGRHDGRPRPTATPCSPVSGSTTHSPSAHSTSSP